MTASNHPSTGLVDRYAEGDTSIAPDALWALEAHLENCAACRDRLSSTVTVPVSITVVDPAVPSRKIPAHVRTMTARTI